MHRTLAAVTAAYYLLLIGVILWSLSDVPVGPVLWRRATTTCQAVALFFGTLGMSAEVQYFASVERNRL
jgi:hypothetical protein